MNTDKVAENIAEELAEILKINNTQAIISMHEELNKNSKQLDDIARIVNEASSRNCTLDENLLLQLSQCPNKLEGTFDFIDLLERLVGSVEDDLSRLENSVSIAEKDLGIGPNIKTIIKPLVTMKKETVSLDQENRSNSKFVKSEIKTKMQDFFSDSEQS